MDLSLGKEQKENETTLEIAIKSTKYIMFWRY